MSRVLLTGDACEHMRLSAIFPILIFIANFLRFKQPHARRQSHPSSSSSSPASSSTSLTTSLSDTSPILTFAVLA
ncbi:hypothetical protein V8E36_008348 [Tilletia maclaganii]